MYYICVENNKISAILNYLPAVPSTVKVYKITDDEHALLETQAKFFNTASGRIEDIPNSVKDAKAVEEEKFKKLAYLSSSDWLVLRHLREKLLGAETTLTDQEYLSLEANRQAIAKSI